VVSRKLGKAREDNRTAETARTLPKDIERSFVLG
jgi:hypothetical protein